jgi:hypothetical protein
MRRDFMRFRQGVRRPLVVKQKAEELRHIEEKVGFMCLRLDD